MGGVVMCTARASAASMVLVTGLLAMQAGAQPPPQPQPQPQPQPPPRPYPQPPPQPYPQPPPQPYPRPYPYPQPRQPGYGQPGYGQPGYGQPGYGQPGYGQPGYGRRGYGYQQPPEEEPLSGEHRLDDHLLDWMTFTVGLTGGVGAAILDRPSDQTIAGESITPGYPGFVGLATAVGLQTELRFLGYVGVEMDVLYASEHGSTEITVTDLEDGSVTTFGLDIGHGSVHVPLLLKGAIPGEVATPMVLLGPEFVIPEDVADFEREGPNPTDTTYGAHTDSYTAVAFGLGLEFNLPVPKVDIRIPFSIRGGYYPGVGDRREDRVRFEPASGPPLTHESYETSWQWTVRAHLGLSVNF